MPECNKMALFAVQLSKNSGGAYPPTPLEKLLLSVILSVKEKNPTFPGNSSGRTEKQSNGFSGELVLAFRHMEGWFGKLNIFRFH